MNETLKKLNGKLDGGAMKFLGGAAVSFAIVIALWISFDGRIQVMDNKLGIIERESAKSCLQISTLEAEIGDLKRKGYEATAISGRLEVLFTRLEEQVKTQTLALLEINKEIRNLRNKYVKDPQD